MDKINSKKNTVLPLILLLVLLFVVSIFIYILLNNSEGEIINPVQSENIDFSMIEDEWTIYGETIGVSGGESTNNRIIKVYSFLHKDNPLMLNMKNKIWDIDYADLPITIDKISKYINENDLVITNYQIDDITEEMVIITNLDTMETYEITNTE